MDGEPSRERRAMIPKAFTRAQLEADLRTQQKAIREAESPASAREEYLRVVRNRSGRLLRGHEEEFSRIYATVESMLAADDDRFPEVVSGELASLFERLYENPESVARLRANEREERELNVVATKAVALSPESMLIGNVDGPEFRLHVASARTLLPIEQLNDMRRGMQELARRLVEDPQFAEVREIVGTSWIVGEHEALARKLGFTVAERPISPEEAAAHFGGEKRVVKRASMTREKFLGLYGEKRTP